MSDMSFGPILDFAAHPSSSWGSGPGGGGTNAARAGFVGVGAHFVGTRACFMGVGAILSFGPVFIVAHMI